MLKVVLVRTEGEENIGSAARVLMNMGESSMVLVDPQCNPLSGTAFTHAVHAGDILRKAVTAGSLKEALAGSDLSAAISRREGQWRKRDFLLDGFADYARDYTDKVICLVFGNEKNGLTNEELQECDVICGIPTSDNFPSLNLAQAVGITLYEITKQRLGECKKAREDIVPRPIFDGMLQEIGSALSELGFFKTVPQWRLINFIRKLLVRARLDSSETIVIQNTFTRIRGMVKNLKK